MPKGVQSRLKKQQNKELVLDKTYSQLFEDLPAMLYRGLSDWSVKIINRHVKNITGYSKDEFDKGNINWLNIIHKDDKERVFEESKELNKKQCKIKQEYRIVRKDGSIAWVQDVKNSVHKDGKLLHVNGAVLDISERKAVEEKLNSLLQNAPNMIIITDRKGTIQFINRTVAGLKKEDVIGTSQYDYIDAKYHDKVKNTLEHVFKTRQAGEYSIQGVGPNNSVSWYETKVGPIMQDEKVVAVTLMTTDVTARKKAEQAVKESEESFKTLFERSADAIFLADPETKKLLDCNKRAKALTGFSKKDIVNMNADQLHPADKVKQTMEDFEKHARGELRIVESEVLTKDGRRVPVSINSNLIVRKGNKILQGVFRDITDRKRAEQEKEELQNKLKQYASRLKIKVKKLEKSKLDLTEKEKLVLYAMTAHPEKNDRELADHTGLKRSTIMSIRNRLKKDELYRVVNIPNLRALGCDLLTIVQGELNAPLTDIRGEFKKNPIPGLVGLHTTDRAFYAVFSAKDLSEFYTDIMPLLSTAAQKKMIKDHPSVAHFPLDMTNISAMFDFSGFLNKMLELEQETSKKVMVAPGNVRLTKNMRELIYALLKYPEASTAEIAKKLRLAKSTVAKNKAELFNKGILLRVVMPDIRKFNCDISAICSLKYAPESSIESRKEIFEKLSRSYPGAVMSLSGDREVVMLNFFKTYKRYTDFVKRLNVALMDEKIFLDDCDVLELVMSNTKAFWLDFSGLAKKMLNIPYEI
jgi:PAS domain S-box-containing protein